MLKIKMTLNLIAVATLLLGVTGCFSHTTHIREERCGPLFEGQGVPKFGKKQPAVVTAGGVKTAVGTNATLTTQMAEQNGNYSYYSERGVWWNPLDYFFRREKVKKCEIATPAALVPPCPPGNVPPYSSSTWREMGINPYTGRPCIYIKTLTWEGGPPPPGYGVQQYPPPPGYYH